MKALVWKDYALIDGKAWVLGCTCVSPRRAKCKIELSPQEMAELVNKGKLEEIKPAIK